MKSTCSIAIMFAFTCSAASVAWGQSVNIGPFNMSGPPRDVGFGPFDNVIPDNPVYKDFAFEGTATNPHNLVRSLGIYFDYINGEGQEVVVLAPNGVNALNEGVNNISANVTLNWCPEEVSIHFETIDGSILEIQGTFTHICYSGNVTTPTLSEWGMVLVVLLLLTGIAIKFGRRRTVARAV